MVEKGSRRSQRSSRALCFLAGVLDCDGSFFIARDTPTIKITSKKYPEILVRVANCLERFGIPFSIERTILGIRVQRRQACFKLCKLIRPYLAAKREHARMLMQFVIRPEPAIRERLSELNRGEQVIEDVLSRLRGLAEQAQALGLSGWRKSPTCLSDRTKRQLSYLAGALEADGCFTISGLTPAVRLTSVKYPSLVLRIARIYAKLGVEFSYGRDHRGVNVSVYRQGALNRLLHLIRPYMWAKREHVRVLSKFVSAKMEGASRRTLFILRARLRRLNHPRSEQLKARKGHVLRKLKAIQARTVRAPPGSSSSSPPGRCARSSAPAPRPASGP